MQEKLKAYIPPLSLFIISFFLYLSLISKGPYHGDSLYFALQAEKTVLTHKLHYLHSHGFPFTAMLGAFFVAMFRFLGNEDPFLAVNFMSVLSASLAVFFLYFIVNHLTDKITALVSSILLSVTPTFLGNAVYGNSHMLFMALFCTSLLFLVKYQKTNQTVYLPFVILFLSLAGASRAQDLLVMSIPLIYLYLTFFPATAPATPFLRKLFKGALLSLIILIIVYAFHFPILQKFLLPLASPSQAGFTKFLYHEIFRFLEVPIPYPELIYILRNITIFGVLLAILGFIKLWKDNTRVFIFILLWLIIPILLLSLLQISASRFLVVCLPGLIIAISYFLSCLFQKKFALRMLGLALFTTLLAYMTFVFFPLAKFRHETAATPEFATWVKEKTEDNAIVVTADEGLFITHFARRKNLPRPCQFRYSQETLSGFKSKIDDYLSQNIPVYITDASLYAYDLKKEFSSFIKTTYRLEPLGDHLYEDWHRGEIFIFLFNIKLYRLAKGEPAACCH